MMAKNFVTIVVIYLPFNDDQYSESNIQHSMLDFPNEKIVFK